ncbi:hypothetical protein FAIPA1_50136 [Frankia sp. AiPs1]
MSRAHRKIAMMWSLDGLATVTEITAVVLSQTHHVAPACAAGAIAVLAGRVAEAVRGQR